MPEPTDHLNRCREELRRVKAELQRIRTTCPHPDPLHMVRIAPVPGDPAMADYIERHYCALCDQKWEEYR